MLNDKLYQTLMFITSIVGTILVAINSVPVQIVGLYFWMVADITGCYIFYKRGMWVTHYQFYVYIWIAVFGLMERISI